MANGEKPNMGKGLGEDGFVQAPRRIAMDCGVSAAMVYGAIWYFARFSDHVCRAEVETIAKFACVSIRTASACLKVLVNNRYITDLDPNLRNKPHRYVVGDIQSMQSISDDTEVPETIIKDESSYTKNGKIRSAKFADQKEKCSAKIADQKDLRSAKIAEQPDSGRQSLHTRSAKNVSSHSEENTKFADELKEGFKELKPLTELIPTESFSSQSESQKKAAGWLISAIQQIHGRGDVPKNILDTWIKPCFIVGYDEQNHILQVGVMNEYAKTFLEGRKLDDIIRQELSFASGIIDIAVRVVVGHPAYSQ